MNKFIAKVLSVIMLLATISSNYNSEMFVEKVYANTNDVDFDVSFTKSLSEGEKDSVPVTTTITGDDTAWFEWDMNNFNESSVSAGNYTLTYPLEDGLEVEFKVNKVLDDEAKVQYRIKDVTTGTYVTTTSYSIYSHEPDRYVIMSDYFDNGYNSPVLNYQVIDTGIDNYPQFIIGPNYGFSFKYNNISVHFKWYEKEDINKMYFYTNQIKKGYIVEPNLNVSVGTNEKDYKKVLTTGISSTGFSAEPYANDDKKTNDIISVTSDTDKFPANDEQDRGLEVQFNVLKTWDEGKFTTVPPSFDVPVTIKLAALDDTDSMTVVIDNIYDLSTGKQLITNNEKAELIDFVNDGEIIKFKLSGLSDGVIYNTTLNVLQDLNVTDEEERMVSNNTKIPFGEVFTFPKYEIISQNNKLYIIADPFHGYKGEFLLKSGNSLEVVSSRQQSDGETQLVFPLSINSENMFSEYYRMYFSPGKVFEDTNSVNTLNTIHSQKLFYRPRTSTDIITIPNNFYIVDYNHIIDENADDFSKGFLEVTYRWDIGRKNNIDEYIILNDEININYELSKTVTPDVAGIEKVSDINVKIEDTNKDGVLEVTYSGGDDGVNEDGVANYVINTETEILKDDYQSDSETEVYYAEVTLFFNTAHLDYVGNDSKEIYFRYPNIYFFTVNPSMLNDDPVNITASIFRPVTLDYLSLAELTPPQNVLLSDNTFLLTEDGDDKDEVSFEVDFTLSGEAMQKYLKSNYSTDELSKIEDENKFKSYFNIYISEDEESLKNSLVGEEYKERVNNSEEVLYKSSFDNTIYVSSINGNTGVKTDNGQSAIDVLRDGEILKITDYPISAETLKAVLETGTGNLYKVTFDGLDTNTKYYIVLDLIVEDFERELLDFSELTPVNAITTKDKLETLKPGENTPQSPDFFEIETETNTTTMGWNAIVAEKSDEVDIDIEYELIRLKSNSMEDEYLALRDEFNIVWDEHIKNDDKKGFRTDKSNILVYENSDFVTPENSLYEYNFDTEPITFTDNTVIPNTVYYYYIRTVKIVDGEELYSVWERIAITTTNIEGPINLVAMFDDYDSGINLKEEVYLKFDAPITELSQLDDEFDLELSILKDGEQWQTPIAIDSSKLITDGTLNEDGYRTFIYKVTGLEAGTTYSFRIRQKLLDQDVTSLYSNTVRIRTEIDQDEYDEEEEIENWGDYVKNKLEQLLNGNYWEISNNVNNKEIIYRETKFDGMLKTVNDGFLNLLDAEPNKFNEYYIPVNSLIKANNKKIGFKVKSDDVTLSLSSNAIDTLLNNQLKPLAESLKDNDIEDYYVKISIKTEDSINKINGNTISSPIIQADIVTKAFDKEIELFEYEVYANLQQQFVDEVLTEDIKDEIKELLEDEKSNEDIIRALDSEIQKYAEDAMEEIEDMFDDSVSAEKYNRKVVALDAPLIISNKKENVANTSAYKKVGENWIKEQTTEFGLSDLIVTNTTGTYVFVNTSIIINNSENIQDATKAHDVLVKYGLYDILKSINGIDANKAVTRDEAYSSIAKILGNKNEGGASYLKGLGMDISQRNTSSTLKEEELVYLLMNVYEYKTNTKINNYQIKNYATLSNIDGVSTKYLKSIQVANDLGIINLNTFNAKDDVTVETFLNTILNVGSKVGI